MTPQDCTRLVQIFQVAMTRRDDGSVVVWHPCEVTYASTATFSQAYRDLEKRTGAVKRNRLARDLVAMLWWRQRKAENYWLFCKSKGQTQEFWAVTTQLARDLFYAERNACVSARNCLYGDWD